MDGLFDRRLQSILAAIAIEAGVPGEFLRMVPQAELIIRLKEVAQREHEFSLAITLEAAARNHIEDSVGTISHVSSIAAARHFHIIDVLGIDLRSDVAGNIGVG